MFLFFFFAAPTQGRGASGEESDRVEEELEIRCLRACFGGTEEYMGVHGLGIFSGVTLEE